MEMDGVESSGADLPKDRSKIQSDQRPVTVDKPIPYTFDLGNLLCSDSNIVPPKPSDADIASISRDCAQALINQLLTTCTITHSSTEGTLINLPPPTTSLPREKLLPEGKPETRWERFARKKGITKKSRDQGKMVYDEEKGDWVPKWGYKGQGRAGEEEWLVEVDKKKENELNAGESIRGVGRRERAANAKRNERRHRANERKARKSGQST